MSIGIRNTINIDGDDSRVMTYREYKKDGFLMVKNIEIEEYELENGYTCIVMPTRLANEGIVKKELDKIVKDYGVAVEEFKRK